MAKAPRPLSGKVAAITGGARGIGRATATALIARGVKVAIGDIDADLAEQTAAELGSGTVGLPLDVTDRESFSAFLSNVENRLGPLDIMINNAGIMPVGPFVEESDALAKRLVDINVHGVILGSKLALERFQTRGRGHLVNIASIVGRAASPYLATYVATKHAVVGLTEALHLEYADTAIDFSIVMPIGTNTELYSGLQQIRGMDTPEPADVGEAIVEALQTGRVDVFVPKRMNAVIRLGALLPRRAAEAIGNALGGNEAIKTPDRTVRAAYEARIGQTMAAAEAPDAAQAGRPPEPVSRPAEPQADSETSQSEINPPISTPASS